MNLGHGRAGHLPDYSFIRYKYLPAWDDYRVMVKDNPSDYFKAFCQMIYAMKYIRGEIQSFETDTYDYEAVSGWEDRIREIIGKRQLLASDDWKAFGQELSGSEIEDFDLNKYQGPYMDAAKEDKGETFIGQFVEGAMAHKWMVCDQIYQSGNMLAGFVEGKAIKKAGSQEAMAGKRQKRI